MRNRNIILFFLIALSVCIIMTACSGQNSEPYSIKENSYDITKGDIPKVYIDTTDIPDRVQYVNANVRVEDTTGQYENIADAGAGIKVRGHTTAHGAKLPYNIKFSDKKNVLGMGNSKKWCLIANMFDPTLMRNMLALDLAENMGMQYISKRQYVELYYNGNYQGIYMICTPVSEGKDKVDLALKHGDYLLQLQPNHDYSDKIKIETHIGFILAVEEGDDTNPTKLANLVKLINNFELAIPKGLDEVAKYANVQSFVDFYVLNELVKDVDFATSSTYLYVKNNKLYIGPAWDYDLSMGNVSAEYYNKYYPDGDSKGTTGIYCNQLWYYYLLDNSEFCRKVSKRLEELQPLIENLTTDNQLGKNRIDTIWEAYGTYFDKNYTMWNVAEKYSKNQVAPLPTYAENVEYLRQWIKDRYEWLKEVY